MTLKYISYLWSVDSAVKYLILFWENKDLSGSLSSSNITFLKKIAIDLI
jgi:hypothetical protein